MSLTDIPVVEAAMQNATVPLGTPITGLNLPAAQLIDNENIAVGLVRKVRRIIFTNLDNAQRTIRLCSCVASAGICGAAAAGSAALGKEIYLSVYEKFVMNPEKNGETVLKLLGVTGAARRLGAYISGGAITTGIKVEIDYYDDLDQA